MPAFVMSIALAVAAVATIAVFAVVAVAVRSQRTTAGVRTVGTVALVAAVLTGFGTFSRISAMLIPNRPLAMTVPVRGVTVPKVSGPQGAPTAQLDSGWYSSVQVESSNFGPEVIVPGVFGHLLMGGVLVLIGVAIWKVCRRLVEGAPFAPTVAKTSTTTGLVTLVAGMAGQVLVNVSESAASAQLFPSHAPVAGAPEAPTWDIAVGLSLWPVAVAFLFLVFATILRFGANVQAQRDDAQRETRGLI